MMCQPSQRLTVSLWVLAFLVVATMQVLAEAVVGNHFGEVVTDIGMIVLITIKYNPLQDVVAWFQSRSSRSRSSSRSSSKKEPQPDEEKNEQEESSTEIPTEFIPVVVEELEEDPQEAAEVVVSPTEVPTCPTDIASASTTTKTATTTHAKDPEEAREEPTPVTKPRRQRVVFLDNLKSFLAALIVYVHVTSANRGELWFFIESNPPFLANTVRTISTLLQGFIMPLFFFVSAYFVPVSFEGRTIEQYYYAKRKRLYYPAMAVILLLVPATNAIGRAAAGAQVKFRCFPAHMWFILWLLLFHWVYASWELSSSSSTTGSTGKDADSTACSDFNSDGSKTDHEDDEDIEKSQEERQKMPFPSTPKRMLYSLVICSILLIPFIIILGGQTIGGMPILHGSWTCDFYGYAMGIVARKNGWLEQPIRDQMDISVWKLRLIVFFEASVMVATYLFIDPEATNDPINILFAGVFGISSGLFTVDMSLMLLDFFQSTPWLNLDTQWSQFFNRSSYTVYLIHQFVVTSLCAIYIQLNHDITFPDPVASSKDWNAISPTAHGGEEHYFIAWCTIQVLSQLIAWPLGWYLANAPVFRDYL